MNLGRIPVFDEDSMGGITVRKRRGFKNLGVLVIIQKAV